MIDQPRSQVDDYSADDWDRGEGRIVFVAEALGDYSNALPNRPHVGDRVKAIIQLSIESGASGECFDNDPDPDFDFDFDPDLEGTRSCCTAKI